MNRITLRDVARAAGVSTASVSRALGAETTVTPELRTRILAAASRLGYRPNLAARALATNRSGLMAIVIAGRTDGLVASVAGGIQGCIVQRGYAALLATGGTRTESLAAARNCVAQGAEGVVWLDGSVTGEGIVPPSIEGVPWVAVSDADVRAPLHIDLGRAAGARLACRYLIGLGHQHAGILVRPGMQAPGQMDLPGTGEAFAPRILQGHVSSAVAEAVDAMLDAPRRPTAIVCDSDFAALAAVRECTIRGIRVPEQLSIVGFGDEAFARCAWPALTTIRVSAREIGAAAAAMLLDTLAGRETASHTAALKLVLRETTGPVPDTPIVPDNSMFHVEHGSPV